MLPNLGSVPEGRSGEQEPQSTYWVMVSVSLQVSRRGPVAPPAALERRDRNSE